MIAGSGATTSLSAGEGGDELQGNAGNDILYGEAGDDVMFGEIGDDVIYGGEGDDIIIGFNGANERPFLLPGETDNDRLYGGAGSDSIWGGLGDDYIDGGAGSDWMIGGAGDDTYIVNTLNDLVFERQNEGTDTVLSSQTYLLNSDIENLVLLGAENIHGTGNRLDNIIIGNSGNNIIDGITGADTMIGGAGDDIYYVDNPGDVILEKENEGRDTVQSDISYTLADNMEDLTLISYAIPERGLIDGQEVLVFGYPKKNELDYMQGDKNTEYLGTCALTSIANLLIQAGKDVTEEGVVQRAIEGDYCITDNFDPSLNGGSTPEQQIALLASYGLETYANIGSDLEFLAEQVRSGRGIMIGVNAGIMWNDPAYVADGSVNHMITITGVVYGPDTDVHKGIKGFFVCDSGRGLVSDMTRYVSYEFLDSASHANNAYALYTADPIKLWDSCIDGTGNALDNQITGTEGNNVLNGKGGK